MTGTIFKAVTAQLQFVQKYHRLVATDPQPQQLILALGNETKHNVHPLPSILIINVIPGKIHRIAQELIQQEFQHAGHSGTHYTQLPHEIPKVSTR